MARKAAGEEPLPEEDPSNPVFKPLPEPSRLESFLITNQISNYCNQINGYVTRFWWWPCSSFFMFEEQIYEVTDLKFLTLFCYLSLPLADWV